jgi:hypothetical protein
VRLTSTPAYNGSGPVMYYPPHPGPLLFLLLGGFNAADVGGRHRVHCFWGLASLLLFLLSPVPSTLFVRLNGQGLSVPCVGRVRAHRT